MVSKGIGFRVRDFTFTTAIIGKDWNEHSMLLKANRTTAPVYNSIHSHMLYKGEKSNTLTARSMITFQH